MFPGILLMKEYRIFIVVAYFCNVYVLGLPTLNVTAQPYVACFYSGPKSSSASKNIPSF
jgi:hypothetical protein